MNASPVLHQALINYPKQAIRARTSQEQDLRAQRGKHLKDLFVEQVEQIVWQYKLAPGTINLPAKPGVPKMQVFRVILENGGPVRRCTEVYRRYSAVPHRLRAGARGQDQGYRRSQARPSEADASKWVVSDYFSTAWIPAISQRSDMPVVLDLAGLYEALLQRLIPLAPVTTSFTALVERLEGVRAKQREIEGTRQTGEGKAIQSQSGNQHPLRQLNNELEELSH